MKIIGVLTGLVLSLSSHAENGYNLWLRYTKIDDDNILQYRKGLRALLNSPCNDTSTFKNGFIAAGKLAHPLIRSLYTGCCYTFKPCPGNRCQPVTKNPGKTLAWYKSLQFSKMPGSN